jgi:hypothetical protein
VLASKPQVLASPSNTRHDSSSRDAKDTTRLAVAEPLDNYQPESLSALAGQGINRGQGLGDFDARNLIWRNGWHPDVIELDERASPVICAKAVQIDVPHDPKQPLTQIPRGDKQMPPRESSL